MTEITQKGPRWFWVDSKGYEHGPYWRKAQAEHELRGHKASLATLARITEERRNPPTPRPFIQLNISGSVIDSGRENT